MLCEQLDKVFMSHFADECRPLNLERYFIV